VFGGRLFGEERPITKMIYKSHILCELKGRGLTTGKNERQRGSYAPRGGIICNLTAAARPGHKSEGSKLRW